MERRLASLLNSFNSRGLPASEQQELQHLINEYFVDRQADPDWCSDDNDTDEDDVESTADESDTDEPLVCVEETHCTTAGSNENMTTDDGFQSRELLARAQQRSCKANGQGCKQIKVPAPASGDTRKGCITQFTPEEIVALQLSVYDMERDAKEMMILGVLSSCMRTGPKTECSKWKVQHDRKKPRSSYCLLTRAVCKDAFLFLLGISQDLLTRLHKHYQTEGLTPPQRRAGGRKNNTRALTLDDTERVIRFIKNYAEDHAVSLPGRVPGFKREDIRLLPSSSPKSRIYRQYADHAVATGYRKVSKSTFGHLWKNLCPHIVVSKPMTDLCWRCQQNNTHIYRSANMTAEEKSGLLLQQQQHLAQVEKERQLYRKMSADAKAVVQHQNLQQLQPSAANSGDFAMHYSFDFAQQVHFPSDAAQPGPLYFLTPRKCGIFGVHCEGLSQQVNFLIDEAVLCSKGSNAVISYLHFFFSNFGLGEKTLHLHCDNCAGQNKNRYVLYYFSWRIQAGLHTEVTINFMPPGHTKFAPDWCFGLLKRRFRRSHVSCLEDMQDVVRQSTPVSQLNIPQLVGRENGTVIVPTYDWQSYFNQAGFKPVTKMKSICHFRFNAHQPGMVFYKTNLEEEEQSARLATLAQFQRLASMPAIIPPSGLSAERQQYLYHNIRQYVRDEKRDTVCPMPSHHGSD